MIDEPKFCKSCGQKIDTSFIGNIGGKKYFEFEDGLYCRACAVARVNRSRKN